MFKNLIYLVIGSVLIIIIGCDVEVSNPPDPTEHASMRIEYDWQSGYDLDANLDYNLFPNIADSFSKVGMKVRFKEDTDHILPQYPGGYFPDNETDLRRYARENLNGEYPWHLLYVSRYYPNIGGGANEYGRAASLNNGYNSPPSPANERYAYLWWADILEENTNQEDQTKVGVYVTTHELGHQRAGLSDFNVEPIYHNGLFDLNGDGVNDCVMNYYTGNYSLNPKFCYDTDENDQIPNNSCKENIVANYGSF